MKRSSLRTLVVVTGLTLARLVAPSTGHAQVTGGFASAAPEVDVHLRAAEPGVRFHLYGGTDVATGAAGRTVVTVYTHNFEELCMPPCSGRLHAGSYRFALQRATDMPIVAEPVDVLSASVVTGSIVSNSGWRLASLLSGLGLLAVGGVMTWLAFQGEEPDWALFGTGLGVGLALSTIVGGLLYRSDEALIDIRPAGPS